MVAVSSLLGGVLGAALKWIVHRHGPDWSIVACVFAGWLVGVGGVSLWRRSRSRRTAPALK